jgi:hypothetical protein
VGDHQIRTYGDNRRIISEALRSRIRASVVNQLRLWEHDALPHLFSAHSEEADMSDKLKEFVRQTLAEVLARATPEERLAGLTAEERLKGLSAEEVIRALPPETLEALARQLKANGSSLKPQ